MISYWRHGEDNDDPEHSNPEDIFGQDHLEVVILFRGLGDANLLIQHFLQRFCQAAWLGGRRNHLWKRLCLNWHGLENEEERVTDLTITWPVLRHNLVSERSPRLIWIFFQSASSYLHGVYMSEKLKDVSPFPALYCFPQPWYVLGSSSPRTGPFLLFLNVCLLKSLLLKPQ